MAIEIYKHKRNKPFIPDKTNFTRENYQIIGTEKIHYSDKEAVEEILASL